MKSLTQFITENSSNAEHEKFMEAVDNYFTILSRELDKKEFIKTLESYADHQSIKKKWIEFVGALLANNKYLNYKFSWAKLMKDSSSIGAVVSRANEWLDKCSQPD